MEFDLSPDWEEAHIRAAWSEIEDRRWIAELVATNREDLNRVGGSDSLAS